METYLLAEKGLIRKIKLDERITDIFKENLFINIATMHPTMLHLMFYASGPKEGGYSETELCDLLSVHNNERIESYEVCRDLDNLVDFRIFDEIKLKNNEIRYVMMPIIAEYLIDLRTSFATKKGDNLIEGANELFGRLLMKDNFFETKNN